jgi:outer membrane usher protein
VSNRVTLGGRGEVDPGRLFSGGPLVNLRLPVGEVEAAASLSRSDRGWGAASHTAFSYVSRPVSAGGSIKTASRQHQTLTANPVGEDPALRSSLFATAMGGPVSITFQHSLDRLYERPSRSRAGVQSTVRLSRQMEFSASVMRTWDDRGRGREVYAAMTVLFGRASASVSHIRDARGPRMAVDAQQPLPAGTGYGFQMRAERGDSDSLVTGVARFQGAHGRYELRQETLGDRPHTTVSAMGALVAIGGGLHATRPVQDSFALIRVPGVEGVRGFASNQEMGRTSRKGDLLVPDLKPYYGNTLDIADSDVPLEYSVPGIRQILAPPYRGGAVALFPVQLVQRIVGRVQQAANEPGQTLAYGELIVTVGQQTFSSPVGGDGEFYFENIPPGTHPATLHGRDSRCVLQLVIPVSDRLVVRLGTVVCQGDRE